MKKIAASWLVILGSLLAIAEPAMAQELSSSGVMNDVLNRFHSTASTWGPAIEAAATRLFWALVVISMVWTFGQMALRKADIGEFFAEFIRFIMFTGFFWWLLTNATTGMNIAGTIVESLQNLGAQAGGLPDSKLGPSSILDLGFELYHETVMVTKELGWRQMATALVMELLAIAILIVLALIAINLLLLMASAWILLYAGIFFLGFGGSRWTSDMAINYYKTVLGIAAQLMAMILLVAIGKQFLNHYYSQISEDMASQELAVMLVIALILLFLVNKVPNMIGGLVSGASIGSVGGVGNFGAGAMMGAAMTAASVATGGAALAGKALMGAAAGTAGGASAIQAAFSKASENVANGSDLLSSFSGGGSLGGDSGGNSGGGFAEAAGFSSSGAGFSGTGSSSSASGSTSADSSGNSQGSGGDSSSSSGGNQNADNKDTGNSSSDSKAADSDASGGDDAKGKKGAGGLLASAAKATRVTADAGANLAKGIGSIASAKASDRVANSTGGKIADAIRGSGSASSLTESNPSFDENSLAASQETEADPQAEVAAFTNRDYGNRES